MTASEIALLRKLGECFYDFIALDANPAPHPNARAEFGGAIHLCQNLVSAREAVRANPEVFGPWSGLL
jgi:hypothetical protein